MKQEYLNRKKYETDLTDKQWAEIEALFVGMREYKYSNLQFLSPCNKKWLMG